MPNLPPNAKPEHYHFGAMSDADGTSYPIISYGEEVFTYPSVSYPSEDRAAAFAEGVVSVLCEVGPALSLVGLGWIVVPEQAGDRSETVTTA